jgi:hypothetical protein
VRTRLRAFASEPAVGEPPRAEPLVEHLGHEHGPTPPPAGQFEVTLHDRVEHAALVAARVVERLRHQVGVRNRRQVEECASDGRARDAVDLVEVDAPQRAALVHGPAAAPPAEAAWGDDLDRAAEEAVQLPQRSGGPV